MGMVVSTAVSGVPLIEHLEKPYPAKTSSKKTEGGKTTTTTTTRSAPTATANRKALQQPEPPLKITIDTVKPKPKKAPKKQQPETQKKPPSGAKPPAKTKDGQKPGQVKFKAGATKTKGSKGSGQKSQPSATKSNKK